MAVSMRPSNRSERTLAVGRIAPLIADPSSLPPAVAAFLTAAVAPAVTDYVSALAAADAATVREGHASDAARAAEEAFDGALRLWARTLTDASGKSLVAEVRPLLGGSPTDILRLPNVEKADRMVVFVPRVTGTPLGGDPVRLAALGAAATALTAAAVELSSAESARFTAKATLREAQVAFDKAWVALDRVATALDPAGNLELRFVRAPKPTDRAAAPVAAPAVAPPVAAPAPTNVLPWPAPAPDPEEDVADEALPDPVGADPADPAPLADAGTDTAAA